MKILAFESSCDETSVSILHDDVILANLISTQDFHTLYGGVVPELSSRAHIQRINPLLRDALSAAKCSLEDIDIVAATAGPGLIGALMIGLLFAKGLAFSINKPFIPVNHIEGHIFSPFLMAEKPKFPLLCLMVSGGHSLLFYVKSFTELQLLGTTVDDAAGESFDKVAKLIGLGYPGGPKIQKLALQGKDDALSFPVATVKGKYDYSFSGLKTSVLRYIQKLKNSKIELDEQTTADIAKAFQQSVVDALLRKTELAIQDFAPASLTLVGGVAANSALRNAFQELGNKHSTPTYIPSLEFCGDNAAMIAFRAKTLADAGKSFSLDYEPFPSFRSEFIVEA